MVAVEAADPGDGAAGLDRHLVVDGERTAGQRAGHDRARAPDGERAVDPQPRPPAIGGGRDGGDEAVEGGAQVVDAASVDGVDGDDLGALEERAGDVVAHVELGQLPPLVVDEADLGERDQPVADAEQREDAQVLLGLRLPPLGGGDDEQARVDRPDAGEHVLDEPHVPGHVDERRPRRPTAACTRRSRGRW